MTPTRIRAIANEHVDAWLESDATAEGTKTLRERVADAITAALYEERCIHGTPPHDLNNPPFMRHCGPAGANE